MKKKFREILSAKCKDMGLTDKAIDRLTELGCEGLADDASDEDITKKVDSVIPFAKEMQAEITRKTTKQSTKQSKKEGEGEGEEDDDSEIPSWFKKKMKGYDESLQKLQEENEALKSEKSKTERANLIAEKAKKLGIPDYLMKRVSFADDADLDKELAEYKQELVNNNLVPKEQSHETGTTDEQMKAEAKSWADALPNA